MLLRAALHEAGVPVGAGVLDYGTGSGALAIAAARLGAGSVTAVDASWPAILTARVNARRSGVRMRTRHGDSPWSGGPGPYDVVLSNPPYLPCAADEVRLRSRRWDAGVDGRAVLDRLCVATRELLRAGGFALFVQSELTGISKTVELLRDTGLKAAVVRRRRVGLGPVLRARLASAVSDEELVVIRADKPLSRPHRP